MILQTHNCGIWIQKNIMLMLMNTMMYVETLYMKEIKLIVCAMCMIFPWSSSGKIGIIGCVNTTSVEQSAIKLTIFEMQSMFFKYNQSFNCICTLFKLLVDQNTMTNCIDFIFGNHP